MTNAEHILTWAECSQEHYKRLEALARYPRTANCATAAARMAFQLAIETYRAMRADREDYSPADILGAAILMLERTANEQ